MADVADDDRPVRQPQDVEQEAANQDALRSLTKDQLRQMADEQGLDVPASATKADLLAALGVSEA